MSFDAAEVNAFALVAEVADDSVERQYVNSRRWQPSGPAVRSIFEEINGWADRLMVWAGTVANQHTYLEDSRGPARWDGEGLLVRAVTDEGVSPSDARPNSVTVGMRAFERINAETLEWILSKTSNGDTPALNRTFLRDAAGERRRGKNRKAVIDAGSAAELALSSWHRAHRPEGKDPLGVKPTLGRYVEHYAELLPPDTTSGLVDPRNDAIHRGIAPDHDVAGRALEIAAEIVEKVEPLGAPAPGEEADT